MDSPRTASDLKVTRNLKVTRKMQKLAQEVHQLSDQLAVLINGLIDQMFDDAKGVNERLGRCLLCGSCAHGCPSSVNTVEIFLKARSIITQYLGLPFAKKIIFKKILSNPDTFNHIMEMVTPFQKLLFKQKENSPGTSCARIVSIIIFETE